jgi:hypothetical protein
MLDATGLFFFSANHDKLRILLLDRKYKEGAPQGDVLRLALFTTDMYFYTECNSLWRNEKTKWFHCRLAPVKIFLIVSLIVALCR